MQPASDAETPEAFFARHRAARLHEAAQIWAALQARGFTDDDVLLLDFTLFGRDAQAGEALATQIAATYATSRRAFEPGGIRRCHQRLDRVQQTRAKRPVRERQVDAGLTR